MKLGRVVDHLRQAPELSPANCGGLIEAAYPAKATTASLSLSPANCGGLIEAMRTGCAA